MTLILFRVTRRTLLLCAAASADLAAWASAVSSFCDQLSTAAFQVRNPHARHSKTTLSWRPQRNMSVCFGPSSLIPHDFGSLVSAAAHVAHMLIPNLQSSRAANTVRLEARNADNPPQRGHAMLQAQGHAWCHGLLWLLVLPPPPVFGRAPAKAGLQQRLSGPHASEQEVRRL